MSQLPEHIDDIGAFYKEQLANASVPAPDLFDNIQVDLSQASKPWYALKSVIASISTLTLVTLVSFWYFNKPTVNEPVPVNTPLPQKEIVPLVIDKVEKDTIANVTEELNLPVQEVIVVPREKRKERRAERVEKLSPIKNIFKARKEKENTKLVEPELTAPTPEEEQVPVLVPTTTSEKEDNSDLLKDIIDQELFED